MDLRIVNTCNNDCLYCLEQSYRNKEKYIDKKEILENISRNFDDKIITFYGGNPLLHPDLEEISKFYKEKGFTSIGILTNTFGLNKEKLTLLMKSGLNSIGFYFNSFDENKQKIITNNGIILKNLLENIILIKNSGIFYKTIIHINKQNISSIANDVLILYKKFLVKNFEFVNYFPFDRPHEKYKDLLEYDIETERKNIDKLFLIIKKEGLNAKFIKFEKNFFGKFVKYYDFERGVLEQILEEDKERLAIKNPFCLMENRCKACFIKDNCNTYEN